MRLPWYELSRVRLVITYGPSFFIMCSRILTARVWIGLDRFCVDFLFHWVSMYFRGGECGVFKFVTNGVTGAI